MTRSALNSCLVPIGIIAIALCLLASRSEAVAATAGGKRDPFPIPENKWNWLAPRLGEENGGTKCAGCTVVVALLEQSAQLHNSTVDYEIEQLCKKLPSSISTFCVDFFAQYGPLIIKAVEDELTADEVCNAIKFCEDQDGQQCRLFPKPHLQLRSVLIKHRVQNFKNNNKEVMNALADRQKEKGILAFNICVILPQICSVEHHLPAYDEDGDTFSFYETLRGTYWRGKDCDDHDAQIHPGRDSLDYEKDENCNGIFGVDSNGNPYESKFCGSETNPMGVAILGDSATAHFRIPPGWVTAADMSVKDYSGAVRDFEDELDWPMLSWSTGHLNTSLFSPDISGPMYSIYEELRGRNLCNTNDYQNLGVNGAKSTNLYDFTKLLGRVNSRGDTKTQKPLMVFMAMIGNDVCGSHHGFSTMTSPEVYQAAFEKAVLYADSILPQGSHIVLVGLADGNVLWDAMHDRIHPIGSTNDDVTYADLYDYLNCLHVSPCWGWMNSNKTVRDLTSAHADNLSSTLFNVKNNTKGTLKNSDVTVIVDWIKVIQDSSYPKWELIEPVDGFHPSQLGNYLLAHYFANQTIAAGIMPDTNPNNAAIKAKFNL